MTPRAEFVKKAREIVTWMQPPRDSVPYTSLFAKDVATIALALEEAVADAEMREDVADKLWREAKQAVAEREKECDARVDLMAEVAVTRGANEALGWVLEMLNASDVSKREVEERLAALSPARAGTKE